MKMEFGSKGETILRAILLDTNNTKDSALELLIEEACRHSDQLSRNEIQQLVQDREKIATTLVSENIAFPHAVKQGIDESLIILGVSSEPILWTPPDQFVRLIVLFVGGTSQHLEAMSFTAKMLRNPRVLRKILNGSSEADIFDIIRKNQMSPSVLFEPESGNDYNTALLHTAKQLQSELKQSSIAILDDVFSNSQIADRWYRDFDGWILTTKESCLTEKYIDKDKKVSILNSDIVFAENELKRLTMEGYFKDIETLIILMGKPAGNSISSLKIVNIQNKEELRLIEDIPYNVSRRVLQLAREIGLEGREGKPVGCLFVIGSEEVLVNYTHQLIVNPFAGYPEEERNIIDPSLEETIKEFSKIDGAFIIKPDGTIKSAGTYIAVSPQKLEHHPGEGARHASARGITAVSNCLAVAVSESTGRMSVYARGRRIL